MKNLQGSTAEQLYIWLLVGFTTALIVSNIASTKIVGIGPFVFDAGTILFPVTYIIGDILTELFGFKRTRRAIWIGFLSALATILTLTIVQFLPSDPSWQNQTAYEMILGVVPRIAIASFAAYLIGETLNSYIMALMKVKSRGKNLRGRMIGSSLIGNAVDTVIFSVIAFAGTMPTSVLVSLIVTVYGMKMLTELIALPFTSHFIIWMKKKYKLDPYERPHLFE